MYMDSNREEGSRLCGVVCCGIAYVLQELKGEEEEETELC